MIEGRIKSMKKIWKSVFVLVLSFALVLTTKQLTVCAVELDDTVLKTVYVDGQAFIVTTKVDKSSITVKCADNSNDSKIEISEDGIDIVTIYDEEEGEYVDFELDIYSLTEKNIDIDVINECGDVVNTIDN